MGNWNINIQGIGCHHNEDYPKDANVMFEKFAAELAAAGHTIEHATFTSGSKQDATPTGAADSLVIFINGRSFSIPNSPLSRDEIISLAGTNVRADSSIGIEMYVEALKQHVPVVQLDADVVTPFSGMRFTVYSMPMHKESKVEQSKGCCSGGGNCKNTETRSPVYYINSRSVPLERATRVTREQVIEQARKLMIPVSDQAVVLTADSTMLRTGDSVLILPFMHFTVTEPELASRS